MSKHPRPAEWPKVPISCGAILMDDRGRLLVLRPTYKSGWTIPGGTMEPNGETPWECCRREVLEETGLDIASGRLVAVDSRPADDEQPLRVRMLFHCGELNPRQVASISVPKQEIKQFRFVPVDEALTMLRAPIARRVREALVASSCIYLENGRPVSGVSAP